MGATRLSVAKLPMLFALVDCVHLAGTIFFRADKCFPACQTGQPSVQSCGRIAEPFLRTQVGTSLARATLELSTLTAAPFPHTCTATTIFLTCILQRWEVDFCAELDEISRRTAQFLLRVCLNRTDLVYCLSDWGYSGGLCLGKAQGCSNVPKGIQMANTKHEIDLNLEALLTCIKGKGDPL